MTNTNENTPEKSCTMKLAKFSPIVRLIEVKLKAVNFLSPLVDLGIRLWMAKIFWDSGILKLPAGFLGIGKGSWNSTIYLFTEEHPLPLLSPEVAAFLGTGFEILCPILLFFGLGSRLAAVILFSMAAFIQISYLQDIQHIYWMILLSVIILHGPGKLSLDYIIRKKILNCKEYKEIAGIK
jgi:putative oxidoreductase